MASMLKRVDNAAFVIAQSLVDGDLKTGGLSVLGLASDGIGYTVAESNVPVDDDILAVVEEIKDRIVSGDLVVPNAHKDVEAFLASNSY
jgi:basic membrane protein A